MTVSISFSLTSRPARRLKGSRVARSGAARRMLRNADLSLQSDHREGNRASDRGAARPGSVATDRAGEGLSFAQPARPLLRLLPECGGNDHSRYRGVPPECRWGWRGGHHVPGPREADAGPVREEGP